MFYLPYLLVICLTIHVYLIDVCTACMCASGAVNTQVLWGNFYAACINFHTFIHASYYVYIYMTPIVHFLLYLLFTSSLARTSC